jgi:hypothetical protein
VRVILYGSGTGTVTSTPALESTRLPVEAPKLGSARADKLVALEVMKHVHRIHE